MRHEKDVALAMPVAPVEGPEAGIAQGLHMAVTHILCDVVESELAARPTAFEVGQER